MNVFEQLEEEHQKISGFLVFFEKINWKIFHDEPLEDELLDRSFRFIKLFVDEVHHAKEEEILFPEAAKTIITQRGGPECTKFYDHFFQSKFLERFLKESKDYSISPYSRPKSVDQIMKINSPLAVPLEDHESGYYALNLMKEEWARIKNNKGEKKTFARYGRWYLEMLKSHIQKEDQCLFIMLREKLDKSQVDYLSERSTEMNNHLASKIKQSLEDFNYIEEYFKPEGRRVSEEAF